jgi:hypothetical protein
MKSNAHIGPACKKQAASPVRLSQESRGFGPRDNRKRNPGSHGADECRRGRSGDREAPCDNFRSSVPPLHSARGMQGLCVLVSCRWLSANRSLPPQTCRHDPESAVRTRARKCLPQLLHYPGAGRVFRDIEMKDPPSTVFDHKETIQDSEGEGRHGEEVHGHDDIAVIAQERSPELAGLLARIQAAEIPRNSAFRDVESELQKLAVNPRSAPACILLYHPSDEGSNFSIDFWPAEILRA